MSGGTRREEWAAVLRLAAARGLAPGEGVELALDQLAARPEPELSAALLAFWLDLPEAQVEALLADHRSGAEEPPTTAPPPVGTSGLGPGDTLGGYEVVSPLGAGGMGQVYRARQRSLGREVALKVLPPALGEDPEGQRRFLREARALGAINHPNVVTCYEVGEDAGRLYIAMELLQGGDAGSLARERGGRLEERRALELVRDAARGLTALEAAGLVHRDIKPHNLFLTEAGQAKLGDLGLARRSGAQDRLTLTGVAVGTLPFMAPEQLEGAAKVDVRADVYALGATLYALLIGRPPRVGQGPPDDLRRAEPPPSPRTVALIRRAMTLDPARRYPSAAALLEALEQALAAPDAARPDAPTERARASTRPAPARAGGRGSARAGVGLALAGAAALGLALSLRAREEPEPGGPAPSASARPVPPVSDPTPAPSASAPGPLVGPSASPPPSASTAPGPSPAPSPSAAAESLEEWGPPLTDLEPASPADSPLRREGAAWVARTEPGRAWHRGALTRAGLTLPCRVRWTCRATPAADSGPPAAWERQHGFTRGAAVFFELGLVASGQAPLAAKDLRPPAWWLSLQVRADGALLGLIRTIDAGKPSGADLVAFPDPGQAATPGLHLYEPVSGRLGEDGTIVVTLEADPDGWRLALTSGGQTSRHQGSWPDRGAPAPSGASLWAHFGNWSGGHGVASLVTQLGRP